MCRKPADGGVDVVNIAKITNPGRTGAVVATSFATPATFGAVLAVAGGWGWTGLLLAASFRLVPERTQSAGAAMQFGLFGGAAIAPLGFGGLSTTIGLLAIAPPVSFATRWSTAVRWSASQKSVTKRASPGSEKSWSIICRHR